jgi:hypothetical protein
MQKRRILAYFVVFINAIQLNLKKTKRGETFPTIHKKFKNGNIDEFS